MNNEPIPNTEEGVSQEEPEAPEEETSPETSGGELLSPIGIMSLIFAGMLDFLLIIAAGLILLGITAPIGIILGKFVNGLGFLFTVAIGVRQFTRSGALPGGEKEKGVATALVKKVFKKQWKKLAASLIHIPTYTWTVYSIYSELKG